jgi:hypothetical protein
MSVGRLRQLDATFQARAAEDPGGLRHRAVGAGAARFPEDKLMRYHEEELAQLLLRLEQLLGRSRIAGTAEVS